MGDPGRIQVIVFDLDDTLYDGVDYCRSGLNAVADAVCRRSKRHCPEVVYDLLWTEFTRGDRRRTIDAALARLNLPVTSRVIRDLVRVYRNHVPSLELPPETRHVLDDLKRSHRLGLLTDGYLPAQKLKVRALGIEGYFSAMLYTETLGRSAWKPATLGFEQLMKVFKTRPDQMAYVADDPETDFMAPNRLGWTTIQINRPARLHAAAAPNADAAAGHTINRLHEMRSLLEAMARDNTARGGSDAATDPAPSTANPTFTVPAS